MARAPSYPSRPAVRRVLTHAARLHRAGRPHAAWEHISHAGMAEHYPLFLRAGLVDARRRFRVAMSDATASRML